MISSLVQANRIIRAKVRVACSTCASRKLKCDGHRPCSRCVSVKQEGSCQDRATSGVYHRTRRLKMPACVACSHSKVACSTTRPCPRCVRLGLSLSCLASTLPVRRSIPRVWARELSPLAISLPFPRSLREFFIDLPNHLSKMVALELALSPERLNQVCDGICWALDVDEVQRLRNRFNHLRILSETTSHKRSSFGIHVTRSSEGFMPDPPDMPRFQYSRSNGIITSSLNGSASNLLGYTTDMIMSALALEEPVPMNPDALPFIYKLFHPDSWIILSKAFLNFYLYGPVYQQFYCQMARCDGRPVPVFATCTGNMDEHGNFFSTYWFKIVNPSALGTTVATTAIDDRSLSDSA